MDGKTQAAAAAASGMSLRTAREWDSGPTPSATKQPRDWRTRPDPFGAVWLTDVEPLLQRDSKGVLEAKWVLEGSGPGGMPVRLSGTSREVARRHKSGVWLYAIDDPGIGK